MSIRAQLLVVVTVLTVVGLGGRAAPAGAAGWLAPEVVTSGIGTQGDPHIAVDDKGDLFVVWRDAANGRVSVSKRPVGGTFEEPQFLSSANTPVNPDIGVDGAGNAVAVWSESSGGPKAIMISRRAAGAATFDAPVTLGAASNFEDEPDIAVSRNGNVAIAWLSNFPMTFTGGRGAIGTTTGTITVSGPFTDGTSRTQAHPQVSINEAGEASAIWQIHDPSAPPDETMMVDRLAGDATFLNANRGSAPNDVDAAPNETVAMAPDGAPVALWTNGVDTVSAASHPVGFPTSWFGLTDLDSGHPVSAPALGFDGATAVAAWNGNGVLLGSTRPAGGEFAQPPTTLTPSGENPSGVAGGWSSQGTVAFAWTSVTMTRALVRRPGGAFGAPLTVGDNTHGTRQPDIAVGGTGQVAAVWHAGDAGQNSIQASIYDDTAPTIDTVTVPATGLVGQSLHYAVSGTDDIGHPTIAWDFGDGSPAASGAAVDHAYAVPGMFHVTVTATDGAGNTASVARDLVVTAPVITPPDLPTRGVDFNASAVSGKVLVSVPLNAPAGRVPARPVVRGAAAIKPPSGYLPFRELGKDDNIPVGSILDASKGVSSITMAANGPGTVTQTGTFSKGVFKTEQRLKTALTTAVMLGGGNFKRDCRAQRAGKSGASAARRRPGRRLFADVKGRFRTRGRNSTATVRGTQYLVKDSCRGTLTSVRQGSVRVFDLVKRKGRTVKAGRSYLARPKSALKRRRR